MKKSLLLTAGLCALGATQLQALNYDLYITGSTAFRANVYSACQKLFDNNAPISTVYGGSATGGNGQQSPASKSTQWTMYGTVSNTISSIGVGNSLTIHAFFTGSVQGMQTVEQEVPINFVDASGNSITNTPTIAFSDVNSASTAFPIPGTYNDCSEQAVCVQPFVMCKSVATSASVTNVTWDNLRSGVPKGYLPLSAWTHNTNDHSSLVYIVERTKDSGTRRTELAEVQYPYNQTVGIYLFDNLTNQTFWKPPTSQTVIIGSAGVNGINLNWGSGYVAGGDVATEFAYNYPGNQSIGILSIGDAKAIGSTANWAQVLPFNGVWPTAAGPAIVGNSGTNDFSPISLGQYPLWAYEVCVYPTVDPSSRVSADQNLLRTQLGDTSGNYPGSILSVLLAVASTPSATPVAGSIDNEIQVSKGTLGSPTPATAVRMCEMTASRAAVGGTITP